MKRGCFTVSFLFILFLIENLSGCNQITEEKKLAEPDNATEVTEGTEESTESEGKNDTSDSNDSKEQNDIFNIDVNETLTLEASEIKTKLNLYEKTGTVKVIIKGKNDYSLNFQILASEIKNTSAKIYLDLREMTEVETIPASVFEECTQLIAIRLPYSSKSIDEQAFYGCSNLISIDLANLNNFSASSLAGQNCGKLENICVSEDNSVFAVKDNILYSKDGKRLVFCPNGKSGRVCLENSIIEICSYAFSGCKKIRSIIVPESVKHICQDAFSGLERDVILFENTIWYNKYGESTSLEFSNYSSLELWAGTAPEPPNITVSYVLENSSDSEPIILEQDGRVPLRVKRPKIFINLNEKTENSTVFKINGLYNRTFNPESDMYRTHSHLYLISDSCIKTKTNTSLEVYPSCDFLRDISTDTSLSSNDNYHNYHYRFFVECKTEYNYSVFYEFNFKEEISIFFALRRISMSYVSEKNPTETPTPVATNGSGAIVVGRNDRKLINVSVSPTTDGIEENMFTEFSLYVGGIKIQEITSSDDSATFDSFSSDLLNHGATTQIMITGRNSYGEASQLILVKCEN
ncbi:MAG: leucine-rich repeat protein [Treponema sp.]|nr:leucine-rich repeat protein [Treponema sp.]